MMHYRTLELSLQTLPYMRQSRSFLGMAARSQAHAAGIHISALCAVLSAPLRCDARTVFSILFAISPFPCYNGVYSEEEKEYTQESEPGRVRAWRRVEGVSEL